MGDYKQAQKYIKKGLLIKKNSRLYDILSEIADKKGRDWESINQYITVVETGLEEQEEILNS